MDTLILGGIKSGKSRLAETLALATEMPVTVIATARAGDADMASRIARHQSERPRHWTLIEEPLAVADALARPDSGRGCVLIDCLTLWLTQLLLLQDATRLQREVRALLDCLGQTDRRIIMVSNETSMGIVPTGELTRRYCDEAGLLHQKLADRCQTVILTIAGLPHYLKGHATPPPSH